MGGREVSVYWHLKARINLCFLINWHFLPPRCSTLNLMAVTRCVVPDTTGASTAAFPRQSVGTMQIGLL